MGILDEVLGQVKGKAPAGDAAPPKTDPAAAGEPEGEEESTEAAAPPDGKKRIHTFSKSFEKKYGPRPTEKAAAEGE